MRSLVKAFCLMLGAGVLLASCEVVAQARDGAPRTSEFDLYADPIFAFNGPRLRSPPSPDCKVGEEAEREFAQLGGDHSTLTGSQAGPFIEHAYAGKVGFAGRIANVDHVAVLKQAMTN